MKTMIRIEFEKFEKVAMQGIKERRDLMLLLERVFYAGMASTLNIVKRSRDANEVMLALAGELKESTGEYLER